MKDTYTAGRQHIKTHIFFTSGTWHHTSLSVLIFVQWACIFNMWGPRFYHHCCKWNNKQSKEKNWVAGDMVFDNVLTTPTWGPKLRSPAPTYKLGISACACKPLAMQGIDRQIPEVYWDMYELQVQWDTVLKNKVESDCEINLMLTSGLHMHACMCTYTHKNTYLYKHVNTSHVHLYEKGVFFYLIFVVLFV